MNRFRLMVTLLGVIALAFPTGAVAITRNTPVTHVQQPNDRSCVATSSYMQIKRIKPSTVLPAIDVVNESSIDPSTMHGFGSAHKYCYKNSNLPAHWGLDPLAWAWILYNWTPAGYYFDDYTYTSAYSGTAAMVYDMYTYNDDPGALVNGGHHAFVFQGADTNCNPLNEPCSLTITNVYVDDPWYHRSGGAHSPGDGGCGTTNPCGIINLAPNRMIAYATWTKYYYVKWGTNQDCAHWNGYWVSVLRKEASATPSSPTIGGGKDPANAPTEDWTLGPTLAEPAVPSQTFAASVAINDIDASFAKVLRDPGFQKRPEIGDLVEGGHVTHLEHVTSLVTNFPDYLLATVVGKHGARAVAMFTLEGARPAFAGLTTADTAMKKYPFMTAADADHAVRESGARPMGSAHLVWGWSAESESPYYPFYQLQTDSGYRYVDQFGQVTSDLSLEAPAR
jgi:hypothetical protein